MGNQGYRGLTHTQISFILWTITITVIELITNNNPCSGSGHRGFAQLQAVAWTANCCHVVFTHWDHHLLIQITDGQHLSLSTINRGHGHPISQTGILISIGCCWPLLDVGHCKKGATFKIAGFKITKATLGMVEIMISGFSEINYYMICHGLADAHHWWLFQWVLYTIFTVLLSPKTWRFRGFSEDWLPNLHIAPKSLQKDMVGPCQVFRIFETQSPSKVMNLSSLFVRGRIAGSKGTGRLELLSRKNACPKQSGEAADEKIRHTPTLCRRLMWLFCANLPTNTFSAAPSRPHSRRMRYSG